jgi:Beta-galactosidase
MVPLAWLQLAIVGGPVYGRPFSVADLPGVSSVCNYLITPDAHDLTAWQRDLDGMKAAGFSTVWVVNVWAEFQPSVDDGGFADERLKWLRGVCEEARKRGMFVLLVAAYIGEGWGPRGVDVPVWPLIPKHRAQHLAYLRWLSRGVSDFDNVFYLLCTEEILPATMLYRPTDRQECVAAFRSWAHRTNPDIEYWNKRWSTTYTWENLAPAVTTDRRTWQTWLDHNRWFGATMRQVLPPMVEAIREGDPSAVVGFHDFLLDPVLKSEPRELPFREPYPFDFYSIGYYYGHDRPSFEENVKQLRERVDLAQSLYSGLPLFCGEIGLEVRLDPPETRQADEELQCRWYREALGYLRGRGVGYSVWSWRTVVEGEKTSLALLHPDGSPRPSLAAIAEVNRRPPGAP